MELKTRNRLKVAAIGVAAVLGLPVLAAALFAPVHGVPENASAPAAHATAAPARAPAAPKNATATQTAAPRPEIRATLGSIAHEFGDDPDEAARTYAVARVVTLGVLESRTDDGAGGWLGLGTPENPRAKAMANLAAGELARAAHIKRGAIVAIDCQGAEEGWDALVLHECHIIKPAPQA